jgi:osmotically-inducible protein OsmY
LQVSASEGPVADALSATSRKTNASTVASSYIHEPGTGIQQPPMTLPPSNDLVSGPADSLTNAPATAAISNHVESVAVQNPQSDLNRVDVVTSQGGGSDQPLEATSSRGGQANVYSGATNAMPDEASGGQSGGINVNVQGASAADQTLAEQIRQELRSDASLASAISQVNISVADGRVTLRGTVKNDVQKREIEAAIQRATGLSSVDNQLRVSAGSPLPMNPNPQP